MSTYASSTWSFVDASRRNLCGCYTDTVCACQWQCLHCCPREDVKRCGKARHETFREGHREGTATEQSARHWLEKLLRQQTKFTSSRSKDIRA